MSAGQISRFLPNDEFLAAINANNANAANPFATIADLPTSQNIYNTDGTLTGNRVVTLGGNNLSFPNGPSTLFHLDATNDRVGIGTNTPGYTFQIESGDGFIKQGAFGVGEAPDPSQRVRITQDDLAGNNTTALRVDHSYGLNATGNMSAIQVRSTANKDSANSTLYGVNVSLGGATSQVTAGTHKFIGLRSKIQFAAVGDGSFTAYGLQIEDGTQGINKVLTDVTGNGEINFVDVNTLVTGTNETLAEVLTNGNTTGGTNIIVTSGDKIVSSSGGMEIDLRYGGVDGDYFFGADPVGFTGNWINGYSGGFGFDGNFFGNNDQAIAIKPQLNQGFQYDAPITVIKQSALGTHYGPISFNQSILFLSTTGSRLSAGQTNTVIAGGNSIIATKGQSLYANKLILQSPNNQHDAIFDIIANPLTAERTYTFQDASGTVAFLSDIVTPTLSAVLTAGDTTANGQVIKALNGGGQLNLRDGANSIVTLTNDNGTQGAEGIYLGGDYAVLFASGYQAVYEGGLISGTDYYTSAYTNKFSINIVDNPDALFTVKTGVLVGNTDGHTLASGGTGGTDKVGVIVGGSAGQINSGVANAVKLGGGAFNVTQDNSANAQLFVIHNSGSEGSLISTTLTADRTYTFQDASGTVAFVGDIPSVATGQTWTDPTNLPGIPVRGGYDANSTTVDELADVLGQLIVDLRATDILN